MTDAQPNTSHQDHFLTRRRSLKIFAGTATSLFACSSNAFAFLGKSRVPKTNLSSLPSSWRKSQGQHLIDYVLYLEGLRLRNVPVIQIVKAHAKRRGSVWNQIPPKRMWKSLKPTLKALDRIASELGMPVKEIVSAYRCPRYNARCRGAKSRSQHLVNTALDVKFNTSAYRVAAVARKLRSRGLFKGGVGRYSSFTHIDTRGSNADW